MRIYSYDDLSSYSQQQIRDICAKGEPFKVTASHNVGKHIQEFLKSEIRYHSEPRSLSSRFVYLGKVWHGLLVPGFVPVWNRAMMDGYRSPEFFETADGAEMHFIRR